MQQKNDANASFFIFTTKLIFDILYYMGVFIIKQKLLRILPIALTCIIILFLLIFIFIKTIKLYNNYIDYSSEKNEMEEYKKLLLKQNEFYKNIINSHYDNQKYNVPYIPDGFTYVEGSWNNGYVIQDSQENQYVWIPCTNEEIIGVPKLKKSDYSYNPYLKSFGCYDIEYESFLNSALKNGGFYVSRFEIGKENNLPVSKKNSLVWNKITPQKSIELVQSMYTTNKSIKCELINGYAYDTMLSWIFDTVGKDNIELSYLDINNEKKSQDIYTGRIMYNNIYDIFDDIQEITQEFVDNTPVSRGTTKRLDNMDLKQKFETRLYTINNISWNDLTFRTMIYKEN